MDPQILIAVISFIAALLGAIVGAGGTIFAASRQHRLTVEAERQKETRAREKQAAETCNALLARLANLKSLTHNNLDDETGLQREAAAVRLDDELRSASLYLPREVRAAVEFAREAISDADNIVQGGYFYGHGSSSIASNVAAGASEILAAHIRDERIPDRTIFMKRVAIALGDLNNQRSEDYTHLDKEYAEEERKWLESHPDAPR